MKAEHRHQLQQNDLAAGMGKLVQSAQGSGSMLLGVGLLVVAVILAYWWWSTNTANRISQTWINWWEDRSAGAILEFMPEAELKKVADQARGTVADQAAQLTLADQLYEKAYKTMFRDSAQAAMQIFEEAYEVYEPLSRSASSREVALRALMGAGRSKESLGDLPKALEVYQTVVDRYGLMLQAPDGKEHPLVAEARVRLKALQDGDGVAFYGGGEGRQPWPQRLPKAEKTNPTTPRGELPPLPGSNLDSP